MKYRLFVKEFIGSRKKMILFIFIVTMFLVAVGVMSVNLIANVTSNNEADVIICGRRDDNAFGYKLYDPIPEIIEASKGISADKIKVVPCISRCVISIQNGNSLGSVMCTIKGYEEQFISERFVFFKGRAPKCNANEVVLGSYIAQMLNLSVGDFIGGQTSYEIGGYDGVGIPMTLERTLDDYIEKECKIVGILDENMNDLNYSIILPFGENEKVQPNTLELYFLDNSSMDTYKDFIHICKMNKISIPSVSERFVTKKNIWSQMLASFGVVLLFSLFIIYLLVSYLCKGMGRKLGLLKSFGITNSTIVRIFAGGLSILVGISYVLSTVIVNVFCHLNNKQLSDFLEFSVSRYTYSIEIYLIQFGLGSLFILCVWTSIFFRIKTTSPKVCMSK